MTRRHHIAAVALAALVVAHVWARPAGAAQVSLRGLDSTAVTSAELGDTLSLEIVVDAGQEELSGFSLFLSYDSDTFRLLPAAEIGGIVEPFARGPYLDGIILTNRVEEIGDEVFLSYAEASGVQRLTATGEGVAATFRLQVVRRPAGDLARIAIEERGHDRASHYVATEAPGEERAFAPPLGSLDLRITGFKIQPLPDIEVVAGELDTVYADLGGFVDQEGATVMWSVSFVAELGTVIDARNQVTMEPLGFVGDTTVTFTALELSEGNEDAHTVAVRVLSRPVISGLPPSVVFAEDGVSAPLDLDGLVSDRDDSPEDLRWTASGGSFVTVTIDTAQRRATFAAAANASGADTVALTVTDPGGLAATDSLPVVVQQVNDPPRILERDPLYPVLGTDGVTVPLEEFIEDVDDPVETLQVLHPVEGGLAVRISDDGRSLEVRGTSTGRGIVRLVVQDPSGDRAAGRQVAVVLPPGASVPPEIGPLPVLRFYGGSVGALSLDDLVRDDGGVGNLEWSAVPDSGLSNPLVTGGALAVAATAGFVGRSALRLTVRDGDGNEDAAYLAVEVLDVASAAPPLINAPPKLGVVAGGTADSLDLDPLVDDPDDGDDRLEWAVSGSQDLDVGYDPQERLLTISAPGGVAGLRAVTLTVADPDGNADTVTIPVLVAEADGIPALAQMATAVLDSVGAESRIDLDDIAFDAVDRESELFWSAVSEPGVEISLDPVTHLLRLKRVEDGQQPPPLTSRVVLTVADTDGKEASVILEVALPPVFELAPIPDIAFYTGSVDSTLDLDDYVVTAAPVDLDWAVATPQDLTASIDTVTHRVSLAARLTGFIGSEVILLTATDGTGRSRTIQVRASVLGRGLTPQIRSFGQLQVLAGQEDRSVNLDEYVVDDDPDSELTWTVTQPPGMSVTVVGPGNTLAVLAQPSTAGPNQVQLLVGDPAGNVANALLEVLVLLGGEPPVIAELPQLLVAAGGPETALSLDLYVDDADTPVEQLAWEITAEPGVAARIVDRRLLVSVPAGESGVRNLLVAVTDPEGNQDEAELTVLIEGDDVAPGFAVELNRSPATSDLVEIAITPDEPLIEPPYVELAGVPAEVESRGDGSFLASYSVPAAQGDQRLSVYVRGSDRAGNQGERQLVVALQWMVESGGSLSAVDGLASLNVPRAASGAGNLASLRRLDTREAPAGTEGQPVYEVGMSPTGDLLHPVVLNLFAGSQVNADVGILRWDPDTEEWEELPTAVDEDTGWLSTPIDGEGLYRLGRTSAENRRQTRKLVNHPNPFPSAGSEGTTIEYTLTVPGTVRLHILNALGQRVRLLVSDEDQGVGTWTARWDGRDAAGRRLASGVYFYQLVEGGAARTRAMLLLH